jgi:exopolyphosphatase/guanosine-5'-triphosphate,3'-diphosphate pyrophosphatase
VSGPPDPTTYAAIDLGSNSFHLVVARVDSGQLHLVDRLRERVALAEGLGTDGGLSEESQARALACLEQLGQRLRGLPSDRVRAVGTNTLRKARNSSAFLRRAEEALGHPIDIISGIEEGRLVYLGVAHGVSEEGGRRLLIDIGGGSTELIVGERFEPLRIASLFMGCVSFSRRHFAAGRLTTAAFEAAVVAARREVEPEAQAFSALEWDHCLGSSGTVRAIEAILVAQGWSSGGITTEGLHKLEEAMCSAGHIDGLQLEGLATERRPVLAGGLSILRAIFESLQIQRMMPTVSALREGVLYDLLGRARHEDQRVRTVRNFMLRFAVDRDQAERVERTAQGLLAGVAKDWKLDGQQSQTLLSWAAQLHEIGLSMSYPGYHRHGAYLVRHSNMPGFSRNDQGVLAALIGGHRRKLRRVHFDELPVEERTGALQLCVLLRLAVILNRFRHPGSEPTPQVQIRDSSLALSFPAGWLDRNSLLWEDLNDERQILRRLGIRLELG